MTRLIHILSHLSWAAVLAFTLSACSITETINNFLSSTSGRSWFTEDGLVKADYRVTAFASLNFENLKQDMAQGRGEFLTSFSTLLGVRSDRQAEFFAFVQQRYSQLVPSAQTTPAELVATLTHTLTVVQ